MVFIDLFWRDAQQSKISLLKVILFWTLKDRFCFYMHHWHNKLTHDSMALNHLSFTGSIATVSYTHLDVYKRQV